MTETYSLTSDFPSQIMSEPLLISEIEDSSITTQLQGVNQQGDTVTIKFASALSGGESTTLDTVVSNHDPTTELESTDISKCDLFYDPVSEVSINNGWTDIPLNVERIIDQNFTHTANSAVITFNSAGTYLITARCTADNTGGGSGNSSRTQSQMRLVLNTGSGFNEVDGSFGYMYHRNSAAGLNTTTVQLVLSISTGNQIKLQAIRISGSGDLVAASGGCSITIHSL